VKGQPDFVLALNLLPPVVTGSRGSLGGGKKAPILSFRISLR